MASQTPEIIDLPPEMLQNIFIKLDALNVEKCRSVCRTWKDNAEKLKKVRGESKFWRTSSCREIKPSDLQDLINNMYPSFCMDKASLNWKEVYKCWHMSKVIMNNHPTCHQLISELSGVSCIRISGEWVLISTKEHTSRLIAKHLWLPKEVELYVTGHEIFNIELISCEPLYMFNVVPSEELEDVFDSLGHTEIWLEFRSYYLQLGRTYRNQMDFNAVKFSGGYRLVLEQYSELSVPIFTKLSRETRGPIVFEDHTHFNNSRYNTVIDFSNGRFTMGMTEPDQNNVHLHTFRFNIKQPQITPLNVMQWSKPVNTDPYIYSWHSSLFISHTNDPCDDFLTFAVRGKVLTQQYPLSQGRVTSALFYNSHLFLGCNTGDMLIYKLNKANDLLTVKVHETPAFKIKVAEDCITHIAVAESVHHKQLKPWIICATSTDVFEVRYE